MCSAEGQTHSGLQGDFNSNKHKHFDISRRSGWCWGFALTFNKWLCLLPGQMIFSLATPKGHQHSWSISSCSGTQPDSSSHPLLAEALQSGIRLNSRFMTQRRPSGRPRHGAGRCIGPQAHSQTAAASGAPAQAGARAAELKWPWGHCYPPGLPHFTPSRTPFHYPLGSSVPAPVALQQDQSPALPAQPQAPCPGPASACPW